MAEVAAEMFAAALARHRAGDQGGAAAGYRRLLAVAPGHAAATANLAGLLAGSGRLDQAHALYRRLAEQRPDDADALYNLARSHQRRGAPAAAEAAYRRALARTPGHVGALHNLAGLLAPSGEAEDLGRRLLCLCPDLAEAVFAHGFLLLNRQRPAEAAGWCGRAAILAPLDVRAHVNQGTALAESGRLDQALAAYRRALAGQPDLAEGWNSLGQTSFRHHQLDQAETCGRRAARIRPDFAMAHLNLASALLCAGRFDEGWREYEWRRRMEGGPRPRPGRLWRGEDPAGRTILLHSEQGLGDTLHFLRYAPLVARRGARVILAVQAPLARLAGGLAGIAAVIHDTDEPPPYDLHCPLLSLPLAFGTTEETIPAAVPYLAADPDQTAGWRRRLAGLPGLRVGLVWAGDPRPDNPPAHSVDRRRSARLDDFAGLAAIPGISLVSLQMGSPARQLDHPPPGLALAEVMAGIGDFADTAALVAALDLVITVDTSMAHLAGALAKPVWVLSRHDGCWRWLLERPDSPWYPTLRLYRQPAPGDWRPALAALADDLATLAAGRR